MYGYAPGGANDHTDCYQCGVVYELTPHGAASTLNILYNFGATTTDAWFGDFGGDGAPVMDSAKNIYGATDGGEYSWGWYRVEAGVLSRNFDLFRNKCSIASTQILNLLLVPSGGNLQRRAPVWCDHGWSGTPCAGDGIVFELTYVKPSATVAGGWQELDLYDFPESAGDGPGFNQLIADPSGNLHGMLPGISDSSLGSVFELSPSATQICANSFCGSME